MVAEGEGGVAVAPAEEEGAPQKIFGVLKVNKFNDLVNLTLA